MEDRTRADVDTHSGAIRNQRPHFGVRNRALSMVERPVSLDMAARGLGGRRGNPSGSPKRKPLPKIYGCENCGKKFDRPSTLKVVRLSPPCSVMSGWTVTNLDLARYDPSLLSILSDYLCPAIHPHARIHLSMKRYILALKVGIQSHIFLH
jgi:hypothetical protein